MNFRKIYFLHAQFFSYPSLGKKITHETHETFEVFDHNLPIEIRSVFLDISKDFDKVWHEGLLCKPKSLSTDYISQDNFIAFFKITYQVGSKGLL